MKSKKGMLHTLEATLAFTIVITFIILVIPAIDGSSDNNKQIRLRVYQGLSSLEKSGKLSDLAALENISGIKTELNSTIEMPLKFTVGMSKTNITYGTAYPKENSNYAYVYFTANKSTLDSTTLALEYVNASDPIVYVNGDLIKQNTGDYSGREDVLEISSHAQTGTNSVLLNTSNNATISYRLMKVESIELGSPEENKSVSTIGYIISGNGTVFSPSEIRVYVWR